VNASTQAGLGRVVIKPTIGRVVIFHPHATDVIDNYQPGSGLAAIVAHVWTDSMVNLAVFDSCGQSHSRTSVPLVQPDEDCPAQGGYCEWMPYQKGQAAKTEALEARVAAVGA